MSRRRLVAVAGWLALALILPALALLVHQSRSVDFRDHVANLDRLRDLRTCDARIDQLAMATRYGLLRSYDPLVTMMETQKEARAALRLEVYGTAEAPRLNEVRRELDALDALIADKIDAIERFKSRNSALRNSLAYYPRLVDEAVFEAKRLGVSPRLTTAMRRLTQALLTDSLGQDGARPRVDAIPEYLERLTGIETYLGRRAETAALAGELATLRAHGEMIFRLNDEVDGALRRIIATDVAQRLVALETDFNRLYQREATRTQWILAGLALLATALVVTAAVAFFRLGRTAARLRQTVGELEFQKFALDQHAIVGVCDADWRLTYVNDAFTAVAGYAPDEALGVPFDRLVVQRRDAATVAAMRAALRDGSVWRGMLRCSARVGGAYFADTTVVPFVDDAGHVFRYVIIQTDVSERQRYEAELVEARDRAEAATRAKSAFLANMSHELRTPLNAITGYSDLLLEEAVDRGDEAVASDSRRIRDAARHLLMLVDEVLDLSRIEAGETRVSHERVPVAAFTEELAGVVRPEILANGNRFDVEPPSSDVVLETDETKLRQALLNLLSNAGKFTEHGRVALRARAGRRATVVFEVEDTGIGIEAGQLEEYFQPFTQGEGVRGHTAGGRGLGLAITRRLTELLGGTLQVRSDPGHGSLFTLTMPGRVGAGAAAPAEAQGPLALVVDDDPAIHATLAPALEAEGFSVLRATSGAEALRLAESRRPAVIVLDVIMPGMDGWTVLRHLKERDALRRIPVVLMTVMPQRDMALGLGAAAFVHKPAPAEEIVAAIRGACGQRGRVLVVGDEAPTRSRLTRLLQRQGVEVQTAADGGAALRALADDPVPAVVILDLVMPEADGFTVIERLAADPRLKEVAVLVLTAKDLDERETRALGRHVRHVFKKHELQRGELVAAVQAALREGAPA